MDALPDLPLESWREAKTTLHLYTQIVGKVRLALHPTWNHWWHATLAPSVRGLTTGPIPVDLRLVELEFDFLDHALLVRASDGFSGVVPLARDVSVAAFYVQVTDALASAEVPVRLKTKPFDPVRVGSDIPFERDETHRHYEPSQVERFHRILAWSHGVFAEFRGRFDGKSSPPQFFWHSFDLALTRFSLRPAPVAEDADAVTKEAYSHEVISFGFWPGDDTTPEPAYYAYAAPEPAGLREAPLRPAAARWTGETSALAILPYADVRRADDPRASLLEFLQSAFEAGAAGTERWRA
jgi:hypothetical protein